MATSGGVVVFLDVNGTRFIQRNSGHVQMDNDNLVLACLYQDRPSSQSNLI